jgi:hypothetical protein
VRQPQSLPQPEPQVAQRQGSQAQDSHVQAWQVQGEQLQGAQVQAWLVVLAFVMIFSLALVADEHRSKVCTIVRSQA